MIKLPVLRPIFILNDVIPDLVNPTWADGVWVALRLRIMTVKIERF